MEVRLLNPFGEDIEIVNFAKHILNALEVVAPVGVVLGEQAFDRVTEALQTNAQRVPGFGFFGAQSLSVQLPGVFESLQGEAFGGETAHGHEAGAVDHCALQAFPGFLVEFGGHAQRIGPQVRFFRFEGGLQVRADDIRFASELLDPLVHHLRVAQRAELAEQFTRDLAHGRPGGIRVHLFHHRRDGAAAPNGHPKIMDGVRAGRRAHVLQLDDDAVHPERKTPMLRLCAGGKGCNSSHLKNLRNPFGCLCGAETPAERNA